MLAATGVLAARLAATVALTLFHIVLSLLRMLTAAALLLLRRILVAGAAAGILRALLVRH